MNLIIVSSGSVILIIVTPGSVILIIVPPGIINNLVAHICFEFLSCNPKNCIGHIHDILANKIFFCTVPSSNVIFLVHAQGIDWWLKSDHFSIVIIS